MTKGPFPMPADKIVGESPEDYQKRTAGDLSPDEARLARAIAMNTHDYAILRAHDGCSFTECMLAGQSAAKIANRFASGMAEAKWVPFLQACNCPPAMIPDAIKAIRGIVASVQVLGTDDPRDVLRMMREDPKGMAEKAHEIELAQRDPEIAAQTTMVRR